MDSFLSPISAHGGIRSHVALFRLVTSQSFPFCRLCRRQGDCCRGTAVFFHDDFRRTMESFSSLVVVAVTRRRASYKIRRQRTKSVKKKQLLDLLKKKNQQN